MESDVSYDKSHCQKESNETIMNKLPTASSTDEIQKTWEILENKFDFISLFRAIFGVIILFLTFISWGMLCVASIAFGISLYSVVLSFHSFSILCYYIVHYQFLLPVMDEGSIIVNKIKDETYKVPAAHPPKKGRSWFNVRHLLPFVTNAGIWLYLWCTVYQGDVKTENQSIKETFICAILGVLQGVATFSAVAKVGLAPSMPKMEKAKVEQGKKDASSSDSKEMETETYKLMAELLQELREFKE